MKAENQSVIALKRLENLSLIHFANFFIFSQAFLMKSSNSSLNRWYASPMIRDIILIPYKPCMSNLMVDSIASRWLTTSRATEAKRIRWFSESDPTVCNEPSISAMLASPDEILATVSVSIRAYVSMSSERGPSSACPCALLAENESSTALSPGVCICLHTFSANHKADLTRVCVGYIADQEARSG